MTDISNAIGLNGTGARRIIGVPQGVISILAGLLIWEALVRILHPSELTIVAPTAIFYTLFQSFLDGTIWSDFTISMAAFITGYALSALVGIPLGLLVGANERLFRWAMPWVNAFYSTPIIGLAPLFVIMFGFGIESKIAVVVTLAIFPIIINTISGARAVGKDHKELAIVYRANQIETFLRILFPGSLPFILTGLRLAVGRGLIAVVAADLFGASAGLGLRLQRSAQSFDTHTIYAVTFLLALLGIVLSTALQYLERRAYRGGSV